MDDLEAARKFLNKVLFCEPRHFTKSEIERLGFSYPPPQGWLKLARQRINGDLSEAEDESRLEALVQQEAARLQRKEGKHARRQKKISAKARRRAKKVISRSEHRDDFGNLRGFYNSKNASVTPKKSVLNVSDASAFYTSWEWAEVRYKALNKYGAKCMLCSATKNIQVDHIKPRSKYPSLALELDNLQILCGQCNKGKSNKDETDFRG